MRSSNEAGATSAFDLKRTSPHPSNIVIRPVIISKLRVRMRRREFITLVGVAAAVWPLGARAEQQATPMIGFLRPTGAADTGHLVAAVRQGLRESGYPSDKVTIESLSLEGQLVQPQVLAVAPVGHPPNGATGGNDKHSDRFRDRGRSG